MTLRDMRRDAEGGRAERLVVLLHGYGADAGDLMGLADPMAPHLPSTAFAAPNAPDRSIANPMGFQWFPIPYLDGSSQEEAASAMARSAAALDAYLDTLADETGVPAGRTALVGFSQGTMMSLEVAPRRPQALAGIVGFSGRLLGAGELKDEAVSKPPVLLIHGDRDDVVPFSSMAEAEQGLTGAGFRVATHVSPGTGHGIAPDGLGVALGFLRQCLGVESGTITVS